MTNLADNIQIEVNTKHLADHPGEQFAFVYHIRISNHSNQPLQLLNRYWLITDGNGHKQEVRGAGVVGEQPWIAPGESYQYNSGALLDTPVGSIQGYYEMQTEQGASFQAPIDLFPLRVPSMVN